VEPREYKFLRTDGRPPWALLTPARLLDASGERSGAFATVTGITARKRDEERLAQADRAGQRAERERAALYAR